MNDPTAFQEETAKRLRGFVTHCEQCLARRHANGLPSDELNVVCDVHESYSAIAIEAMQAQADQDTKIWRTTGFLCDGCGNKIDFQQPGDESYCQTCYDQARAETLREVEQTLQHAWGDEALPSWIEAEIAVLLGQQATETGEKTE